MDTRFFIHISMDTQFFIHGAAGSVHKKEMFYENLSCRFDERRVDHYETANKEFAGYFKLRALTAADSIAALLHMDIAFLKSCEVEWEISASALAGGTRAEDDDDKSIETATGKIEFCQWESLLWDVRVSRPSSGRNW